MSISCDRLQYAEHYDADEEKLWEQFSDGDLNVYERIFRRYYRDLFGYGLKLCSRPELVRDCIQELFVIIWDRREYLDDIQSVKAYLLASLRRSILKELRRQRKYDDKVIERDPSINIQFSPEELIVRGESKHFQKQALYDALERLPDRQKEVLYLKYFNGMSYDEIEEILSINYQSIRNHIYRAVKKLRKILGKELSEIVVSLLLFFLWTTHRIS